MNDWTPAQLGEITRSMLPLAAELICLVHSGDAVSHRPSTKASTDLFAGQGSNRHAGSSGKLRA